MSISDEIQINFILKLNFNIQFYILITYRFFKWIAVLHILYDKIVVNNFYYC